MKKLMVMLMAVGFLALGNVAVSAQDTNTAAQPQAQCQTEDSAGIHGNIIDAVQGKKCKKCPCCKKSCKCGCQSKAKCDCCKEGCTCGDCPACTKCNCCDKSCKCGCQSKAKCDCCKEGCTCGDCPACTKCNCDDKCTCGCNSKKDKKCKCKKGCKVKK